MRRPLIPLVVSYIYGIVAAELFRYFPVTVTFVSLLLFILVIYLIAANPQTPPFSAGCEYVLAGRNKAALTAVFLAAVTGFFYMLVDSRVPYDDVSHYATGEKMTVIGVVDGPVRFSSTRVAAHVRVRKILKGEEELHVSGRVRVTVYDPQAVLSYGDIIRFSGRLKMIRGFKNPGLFDYSRYVAREGIRTSVGIGKKENISKIGTGGSQLLRRIYGWREEIRLSIVRGLSGPSSAILQAMIVGAAGDLTPEVRDKFNAAGVTHILSISGSHLGFVSFMTFFIIRYALMHLPSRILLDISLYATPSKIAALGTFPPVIFYTLLSGGEIATVRSLIMAMVYLTAILIEREDDAINTLVVAALLVLLWDPQALFDISFQLSYMAVLAMILVVKRFYKKGEEVASGWFNKYRKRFALFILLTLGASFSTAPIVAHYYNQITWVGLISNMVIVPFVGFTVLPAGLLTSSLVLISHADVIPLAWLNDLLLGLLYKMVEFFARFPLSVIYTPSPDIPFIFSIYLFTLSLLFLKGLRRKILLPLSISLMVFSLVFNPIVADKRGLMRITFLDVGQGESALIEFPDGKVMVIDGGGTFSETFDIGRSVVAPYLWNKGIRKIDYVVSTHPQLDHVEGLAYIVDKFTTGETWTNGRRGAAARTFDHIVQSRGIKRVIIHRGMEDRVIGGCRIGFLNPPMPPVAKLLPDNSYVPRQEPGNEGGRGGLGEIGGLNDNDLSIVIRLACKDVSFLFTGDIEARAMKKIVADGDPLASTVIKVPHHGARGSVEDSFISGVKPRIAVISAGYQNSYRHPSTEAISAYKETGAALYRTDLDGAVIMEAKGGGLEIRTYEGMALRGADLDNFRSLFMTELSNLKKIMGVKIPPSPL